MEPREKDVLGLERGRPFTVGVGVLPSVCLEGSLWCAWGAVPVQRDSRGHVYTQLTHPSPEARRHRRGIWEGDDY